MKTKKEEQSAKELELAHAFEIEELEDRLEFKTWHGKSLEEEAI